MLRISPLLALMFCAVAFGVAPASASARACPDWKFWSVSRIATRHVGCAAARRVIKKFIIYGPTGNTGHFTCRIVKTLPKSRFAAKCKSSGRAVSWVGAAQG